MIGWNNVWAFRGGLQRLGGMVADAAAIGQREDPLEPGA